MTKRSPTRRRILFVAEAVTLAHFARCVALVNTLDPGGYDVHVASDPRYLSLVREPRPFTFHPIRSIPTGQFTKALAEGKPVFDTETLAEYVEDDLRLLNETQPDLVVGDFRLSLAVSAPTAATPYASIINAYWSPYARVRFSVPDLPFVRILGVKVSQQLFALVRPVAFALHAVPLNRLRRRYGLPSLGYDLREVYSWADYVLYPDLPDAMDMAPLPKNHRFIGPILWSASAELPAWWGELPNDRPIVYVTLGSSGRWDLLPTLLKSLADLPITVIASSASQPTISEVPENAYLAPYLPGAEATARSRLVICNGGSMTTHEALAAGVPVLGIASNMDQFLNMQGICRLGAGIVQRADELSVDNARRMVAKLLDDTTYTRAATGASSKIVTMNRLNNFDRFLREDL
jgi:UDP:flavonoid glycosyltransferase YjiC (YdhE family)